MATSRASSACSCHGNSFLIVSPHWTHFELLPLNARPDSSPAGQPTGPAVYYAGAKAQSAASLIEVAEGTHLDGLVFTVF
jgi:hypothetical protein